MRYFLPSFYNTNYILLKYMDNVNNSSELNVVQTSATTLYEQSLYEITAYVPPRSTSNEIVATLLD